MSVKQHGCLKCQVLIRSPSGERVSGLGAACEVNSLGVGQFRLGEVPIHFKNRARDASKLTSQEITMAFLNFALLRLRYGFRPRKR